LAKSKVEEKMFGKGELKRKEHCCSFCHKAQSVVGKLISSPSDYDRAYICDECIALCNSIMEDDRLVDNPQEMFPVHLNLTYMDAVLQVTRSEAEQLRDRLNKILASPSQESPHPNSASKLRSMEQ
jgi:hypothetical protein